jgi:hypothetical protein
VLSTIALSDIENIFSGDRLDDESVETLCRARRFDFLEGSERKFDAAVNEILNGSDQVHHSSNPAKSILGDFSYCLSPTLYYSVSLNEGAAPLTAAIKRTFGINISDEAQTTPASTRPYANYSKCEELINVVHKEWARSDTNWIVDSQPGNNILEAARNLWGETRKVRHLATLATRFAQKQQVESSNLLDRSQPLVERTLHARERADNLQYWTDQLDSEMAIQDQHFVCMVALALASVRVLSRLSERLDQFLVSFGARDWAWIYDTGRACVVFPARRKDSGTSDIRMSELPSKISARTATALAMRGNRAASAQIFRKFLRNRLDKNSEALEFATRAALDMKHFGADAWKPNLDVIKQAYVMGESSPTWWYELDAEKVGKAKVMPLAFASKVVNSPGDYPNFLIALAVQRCRAEVAKGTVPVANIAERDHWFGD